MPVNPSDPEEQYFKAIELEQRKALRERLDTNAQQLAERRRIAAGVGTDDLEISEKIKSLGFDGDTAPIFDLLALVHVAWADGKIQQAERAKILGLLKARGIQPGSPAFQTMESMLEERPPDSFMNQSLDVLRQITHGLGERERQLIDLCVDVAAASGGILGLGQKISDEERRAIEEILEDFGPDAGSQITEHISKSKP